MKCSNRFMNMACRLSQSTNVCIQYTLQRHMYISSSNQLTWHEHVWFPHINLHSFHTWLFTYRHLGIEAQNSNWFQIDTQNSTFLFHQHTGTARTKFEIYYINYLHGLYFSIYKFDSQLPISNIPKLFFISILIVNVLI